MARDSLFQARGRFEILGSVVFSEIRASTVGSNGGGEGAKTKGRRRRDDEGGGRHLVVPGSRREGNNSCFVNGKGRRAEYFRSEASEVPSSRLAEITGRLKRLNI